MWSKIAQITNPGFGQGQFENARGLSLSNSYQTITIADINNKRIQVLNNAGQCMYNWPIEINGTYPCPLDVERVDENILASIVGSNAALWHCPDVIDFTGIEIKLMKIFGGRDLVFPRSIVQNHKSQFIISDVGKHRVSLHDKTEGNILASFGKLGDVDNLHLNWPYYMCIDHHRRLAISDSHNHCVKLFDSSTLEYIGSFGKNVLTLPMGICCSVEKNSYFVSEYESKTLIRFSMDGKFMEYVDQNMNMVANDVAIYQNGNLVVSNYYGYTIYQENGSLN